MAVARFPGSCCVCGGEFEPRVTEIEVHPTIVGPKGGKKMVHSNPAECSGARENAGRRKKRGLAPYAAPQGPRAGREVALLHAGDLRGMSMAELRELLPTLDAANATLVKQEIKRRERNEDGAKSTLPESLKKWKAKKARAQAAANPVWPF